MTNKDKNFLKKLIETAPIITSIFVYGDMNDLTTRPIVAATADRGDDYTSDMMYKCNELFVTEYNRYENGIDDIHFSIYFKDHWIPEYFSDPRYVKVYENGEWFV